MSNFRPLEGTRRPAPSVRWKQLPSGEYAMEAALSADDIGALLQAAASNAGWRESRVNGELQQFNASRVSVLKHQLGSRNHEVAAHWFVRGDVSVICWVVHDTASQFRRIADPDAMRRFGEAIASALHRFERVRATAPTPPHDPVIAPGQRWHGGFYTGDLCDYSRLASPRELGDLKEGLFVLGTYAFPGLESPRICIPDTPEPRSRELLRHRGILLCAPTRSGKTSMILRWAEDAIANGYSAVIVDPKGNLRSKLRARLHRRGVDPAVYHFSTDPRAEQADTINFLEGLGCGDSIERDRLRQVMTALLPVYKKSDGEEEWRRALHRDWAYGILLVLKMAERYFPDDFTDDAPDGSGTAARRSADLGDLYDLASTEQRLVDTILAIRRRESEIIASGKRLPIQSIAEPMKTLAAALDRHLLPGEGKRKDGDTYEGYMQPLRQALAPFAAGGLLYERTGGVAGRRSFRFDMLGSRMHPVTLILTTREQDDEQTDGVLQLAITRLRHMVLDRMPDPDLPGGVDRGEMVLFLDETGRIKNFDAAKHFKISAEAGVTTVVVYQSLEDIGDDKATRAVMRNVGIQMYLGSVRDEDEKILNKYMGERSRPQHADSRTQADTGATRTTTRQAVPGAFFPPPTLFDFPAGRYPALVIMNDHRHAPFFVDTFDPAQSADL